MFNKVTSEIFFAPVGNFFRKKLSPGKKKMNISHSPLNIPRRFFFLPCRQRGTEYWLHANTKNILNVLCQLIRIWPMEEADVNCRFYVTHQITWSKIILKDIKASLRSVYAMVLLFVRIGKSIFARQDMTCLEKECIVKDRKMENR